MSIWAQMRRHRFALRRGCRDGGGTELPTSVTNSTALLLASAGLAAIAVEAAQAGAFALREQSAYGQGMSFAGVAAGGSLSSSFWNPATLSQVMGFEFESVGSLVVPTIEITPDPTVATAGYGASGDIGQDAFVPAAYGAVRLSESFVAGISITGPFGLVTDPATNWAGQTYSRSSKVFSTNVNPMVAYQFGDMVSIGAGVQIQYFDTRLKTATDVVPGAPSAILEGDDIGFGFNLGLQLRPAEGTEIGVGFRSSIAHDLQGTVRSPAGTVPIGADLDLPEMVSLGIRQRIGAAFTVAATAEWTNWSRLGTVPAVATAAAAAGATITTLPFEYDDGWFFSLGGEYAWSDRTALRAGIGYELSPVSDAVRGTRLPDDDRIWLSAGLSHQLDERFSFDLGYTFVSTFDTRIGIDAASPHFNGLPFSADVDSNVHIFAAAVKVKLGTPAAAAADEPLVRKY